MKRIIISALLLGLVLMMGQTVFAGDGVQTLRITISTVTGAPGSDVTVQGTGANPDFKVTVTLAPQADSADGAFVTQTLSPKSDGTFETTLTVPEDMSEGHYFIRAEQFSDTGNVLQYYWNGFTVGAVASANALLPETGAVPGTSLSITAMLALLLLGGLILRGVYGLVANR